MRYNPETVTIRVAELLAEAYANWQMEDKEGLTEQQVETYIEQFDRLEEHIASAMW